MKLHIILITPKLIEEIITYLYYSKPSCLNSVRMMVQNNCPYELSYMLAELFNMCLKESCFLDCCKA